MKLALLLMFLLVKDQRSDAFLSKLGSVGTAMKMFSSNLFNKVTGQSKTEEKGDDEGDLIQQMEFLNGLMKKVVRMFTNKSSAFYENFKPMSKMMSEFVIPNYDQLNYSEDVLRAKYNYSPEQIKKFKLLFFDTRKMLYDMKENTEIKH